jgi:hypothetical protein
MSAAATVVPDLSPALLLSVWAVATFLLMLAAIAFRPK